jgi:hypothetical protein
MSISHVTINILADLFPAGTIAPQTENPDMTRLLSILSIVDVGTNRYCFAIVRDGCRLPKQIPYCFPGDVLAYLLPSAGDSHVIAI